MPLEFLLYFSAVVVVVVAGFFASSLLFHHSSRTKATPRRRNRPSANYSPEFYAIFHVRCQSARRYCTGGAHKVSCVHKTANEIYHYNPNNNNNTLIANGVREWYNFAFRRILHHSPFHNQNPIIQTKFTPCVGSSFVFCLFVRYCCCWQILIENY